MAETIFEIFDPVTGKTEGYRCGKVRAVQTCERLEKYGHIRDYLPVEKEGFYVVDMHDHVKSGPWSDQRMAQGKADFENMCSDVNSFRVVQHEL